MHPFFVIVAEAGIRQDVLAGRMNYSESLYTMVKNGQRTASPAFQQAAVQALRAIGLRKADGTFYARAELFLPASVRGRTSGEPRMNYVAIA